MVTKQTQAPDFRGGIAFGSGLAATLLLLAAFQGSMPGLLLAYLSPLPLMIATLGFGHMTGLGAVFAGFITLVALLIAANPDDLRSGVALFSAAFDGLVVAVCEGLPAWWLARLASPTSTTPILPFLAAPAPDQKDTPDNARLGLLISTAAIFAILIVGGMLVSMMIEHENFSLLADKMAATIKPVLRQETGTDLLRNGEINKIAGFLARALPAIAAGVIFLVFLVDLWLAGRIAQISQRLPGPWPDIARDFRLPRFLALVFVAAAGLIFVGGAAGLIASLFASVLAVAFALQGLAVIHIVTRGQRFRGNLLFVVYLFLVPLLPWSLAPFTLLGLLEAGLSLRDRKLTVAMSQQ